MRTLATTNPPMHGADVLAAQRALKAAGFEPGAIDGEYGPGTAAAAKTAKWTLGYPKDEVDGAFGDKLARLLAGGTPPDGYAARARARKGHVTKASKLRAAIVENALWGIAHEPNIHYAQERPFLDTLRAPRKVPMRADCSEFVTDCYAWAGAPDPNGSAYNGLGFTGTLLKHGRHIALAAARPADLVVYGPGSGHHVCMVIEAGADPLLASHGQERGPMKIRHSEESRYQPTPATFLSYLP